MLAADHLGLPYESLVGHWYKTGSWRETCAGIISSEENPRDVEIPSDVLNTVLLPPITKRLSGKRKTSRIPSIGEFPAGKKSKGTTNKCGRCKSEGHNRTRCTNPI